VDFIPDVYSIVFCRTRQETEVASQLILDGYSAKRFRRLATQRDSVMEKFRNRGVQMLIATDVAARGLDVSDLTLLSLRTARRHR
jgi:ATP-dependent RNA helicase DeaD